MPKRDDISYRKTQEKSRKNVDAWKQWSDTDIDELSSIGEYHPKDMVIKRSTFDFVKTYISSYHYAKTTPISYKDIFVGYYGNKIAGIVIYGLGTSVNQYTSLIPDIKNGEYRELVRVWSPDGMPKNTESRLIGKSLKMLSKKIRLVLSYSDPGQNHLGIIYQATNWLYCGMSVGGKQLVDKNGFTSHIRLLGIYKRTHPEYKNMPNNELMKLLGFEYKETKGKHRYVMLRGSKKEIKLMMELIKDKIKPYPKKEN